MPTALRVGSYRFFFRARDGDEPAHVHIEREAHVAKVWLDPVAVQNSGGFRRDELNRILRIVEENQERLLESWNGFFKD